MEETECCPFKRSTENSWRSKKFVYNAEVKGSWVPCRPARRQQWMKPERFHSALMLALPIEKPGELSPIATALNPPPFYWHWYFWKVFSEMHFIAWELLSLRLRQLLGVVKGVKPGLLEAVSDGWVDNLSFGWHLCWGDLECNGR